MVLFIEHINKIPQPNTFQARKLILLIPLKQATQQVLRHDRDLTVLHTLLPDPPQVKGRSVRPVADSGQNKPVPASEQEREDNSRWTETLDDAPEICVKIKRRYEAGIDAKDVEPTVEEGRGQGLGGVPGSEVSRERRTELPGVGVGVVDLDGQAVFYVDQVADEPDAADDDEVGEERGGGGEDAEKRVDAGEVERGGGAPGAFEDAGVGKGGGGDEEEAVGAEEGGVGVVMVRREDGGGEEEPAVGERIEGEGLVVLGGGVVDAEEEEPRVGLGLSLDLRGGEGCGGDDGLPELANGGDADEGRDREVGEDQLRHVGAQAGDFRHRRRRRQVEDEEKCEGRGR
ncbi:hypothetical protein ACLB2K_019860 [Fragaria x ananassa]